MLLGPKKGSGLDARLLGWLVSLHDIGKISRPFQAKVEAHWPSDALGPFTAPPASLGHDAFGWFVLKDVVDSVVSPILPARFAERRSWTNADKGKLWRALAGHHGRPPVEMPAPFSNTFCGGCREASVSFAAAMRDVFRPPPFPRPQEQHDIIRLVWHLAGITTLADWIGSRQSWFPYVPAEAVADPAAYFWNRAIPQAAAALSGAGLSRVAVAKFGGIRRLFPVIKAPSPVQEWAQNTALPNGPVLAVIEDLTGSGKTEAALTLAHRLMAAGRAQGIYVALPTMATANAMYGRLAEAYQRLFASEARPSLALAHGRAALNPAFRAAFEGGDREPGHTSADPADDPAESHCAAWLADDRRKALLAQVGVGTLDQALLAALPVRHATLRQYGLASKVLIVDEAHAFDAYMKHELAALLRFQAALGGSVILLSATLPRATRQQLVNAFRDGLDAPDAELSSTAYPLATLACAASVTETPCGVRDGLPRRVEVTRLDGTEAALERIVSAAAAGAAVAWVRNTVDDAIAAADLLRARGVTPMLFHARFAMSDRLAIEAEVLRRFGRDGEGDQRRCVLVATQIIEQSLDIDFDLLCTDLAPADLLIQRAGRLWRHRRGPRPVAGPEMLVVSPEAVDDPAGDWIAKPQPGTAAVYHDPALLWRGARALFGEGALVTPDDMRSLIEATADTGNLPDAMVGAADKAEGKILAQIGLAAQNVLEVWDGYDRAAGLWEPDTRTPTRLEDPPQVTLRLARLCDGRVVPYAEDEDLARAWALSEVTVARFRIAVCPPPAGAENAIAAALATWGRWERESERMLLALMTKSGGASHEIVVRNEAGVAMTVSYSTSHGLEWPSRA